MTDLVDGLAPFLTHIKPIWTIDDHPVDVSDVFITVNYALGDDNGGRVIFAYVEGRRAIIRRRFSSIVPKPQHERGRPDKAKEVGLIDMLVRATLNARTCKRYIRHYRIEFFG